MDELESYEIERRNMLVKRNRYWASLKAMRAEYSKQDADGSFYEWVADKYGIEVLEEGGMIMGRYNIVDDSKYLVYWLKYSK